MRRVCITISYLLMITSYLGAQDGKQKKVIYETDMCLDVDDVGAIASLHAMADGGEVELLAICFNEVHPNGGAAIDAINTWYGRGSIPIGVYKKDLANPDDSPYLEYVAEFPHDITSDEAPSALEVYLKVLAEQPDKSVTIISVGFLNNLYDLLLENPQLIEKKVKELVVMAGLVNDGFNLRRHDLQGQSAYVLCNWPTPLIISQRGGSIYTGEKLSEAPKENPVREAYYRYWDEDYKGRSSWDQVAVLYGVRGLSSYFNDVSSGQGKLPNGYVWHLKPGHRLFLEGKLTDEEFAEIIEAMMIKAPAGK